MNYDAPCVIMVKTSVDRPNNHCLPTGKYIITPLHCEMLLVFADILNERSELPLHEVPKLQTPILDYSQQNEKCSLLFFLPWNLTSNLIYYCVYFTPVNITLFIHLYCFLFYIQLHSPINKFLFRRCIIPLSTNKL